MPGRSLDKWAELVRNSKLAERKDRIALLKDKYGLGSNSAWHVVEYANDSHSWDGDPAVYLKQAAKYVRDMFDGNKAGLRPIFDRLYAAVRKLGPDVKVS